MVVLMALQPYGRLDGRNAPSETRRSPAYRALPEYAALKERLADRLVARASAVIPGLGEAVVVRKVATPMTMERYTFNTGGAAFGWANIPQQCGAHRPGPRTPVRNLYLAGHWTFPGKRRQRRDGLRPAGSRGLAARRPPDRPRLRTRKGPDGRSRERNGEGPPAAGSLSRFRR